MASLIPGHAHGQVIDCRIGPGAIHGRVVDSDGNAVIGSAAVGLLDRSCGTVPDATGRFSLAGLPADSVLLVPLAAAYCIAPRWVTTSDEDELLLIALPNLTGEAEILVHGGPREPPPYEVLACRAASQQVHKGVTNAADWIIPSPDEVLSRLLQHAAVLELMERASDNGDAVEIEFRYGPVFAALPMAPIPYRLGWTGPDYDGRSIYMFVLSADVDVVEVQVARLARIRGALPGQDLGEEGVRIEWRRSPGGWTAGAVTERWDLGDGL